MRLYCAFSKLEKSAITPLVMLYFRKDLEHMERMTGIYLQYVSKHQTNKTEQVSTWHASLVQ